MTPGPALAIVLAAAAAALEALALLLHRRAAETRRALLEGAAELAREREAAQRLRASSSKRCSAASC